FLGLKHEKATRPLVIASASSLRIVDSDGEEHKLRINMESRFLETTQQVSQEGTADIRLQYNGFRLGISVDGKAQPSRPGLQRMVNYTKLMAASLSVDRRNQLLRNQVDVQRVPRAFREELADLHEQIQQSLEAVAIPLPDKEVAAGESWTARRPLI